MRLAPVLVSWDYHWHHHYPAEMREVVVSNYAIFDESQVHEMTCILLKDWERVIVDNGAFTLFQMEQRGHPSVIPRNPLMRLKSQFAMAQITAAPVTVILPDFINDPHRTTDAYIQCAEVFRGREPIQIPPNVDSVMTVVQGGDVQTRRQSFALAGFFADQFEQLGYHPSLGIPTSPWPAHHMEAMIQGVEEWNVTGIPLHLLGATQLEYFAYAARSHFESGDTSIPFHQIMDTVKTRFHRQQGYPLPRPQLKQAVHAEAERIGANYARWYHIIQTLPSQVIA